MNQSLNPFIKIENLTFSVQKNLKLIDDITFNVNSGKIHGLIGPNGAGKTTLIKLIINSYQFQDGHIYINDLENTDPAWKARLGYIPESCKYSPIKKVKSVLQESAYLFGISNKDLDEKIQDFSKKYIDITMYLNQRIKSLSSGQQKLIMIFDALLNDPQYLILDEPTENLDPTHRSIFFRIITDFIDGVSKEVKSIFISSHVLTELKTVCDEITILNIGKVILSKVVERNSDLESMYENAINTKIKPRNINKENKNEYK